LLAGTGHIEEILDSFRLRIPGGSFFQANPPLAAQIFKEIARRCGTGSDTILELYAGVGALTLFLAGSGRRVTAVEGNPDSVGAARVNAELNGISGIEWLLADVREAIDRWAGKSPAFDIVVLDPPRTGLPRQGARRLACVARRKILYLSCDPATLARDLRDIVESGEWTLKEVLPVDFFPHTAGIECLAILEKG
jgi:SAM-dependent methyltransferases related to tRNA (uracil-5-)-methyltransferase